jgi:XTP/dITP diphosphohydrolase
MKGYCSSSRPSGNRLLLLATTNEHKFFEIRTALGQIGIPLYSLRDFPPVAEAPEIGSTFNEIAAQKAQYYWKHFGKPVIAEDSGLVIPALNNFPGIRSARIASDDPLRIQIVLDRLRSLEQEKDSGDGNLRDAYYICNMIFIANGRQYAVEGRCDGTILEQPDGEMGFGYDPIFLPNHARVSFGRMSIKQKSQYSHRAKAVHLMIPHILAEFRQIQD